MHCGYGTRVTRVRCDRSVLVWVHVWKHANKQEKGTIAKSNPRGNISMSASVPVHDRMIAESTTC